MRIIDGHCDVLWKLSQQPDLSFENSDQLHVNYERISSQLGFVENFAIFVDPNEHAQADFQFITSYIELFRTQICDRFMIQHIRTANDLQRVIDTNSIGALLSLEGCHVLDQPETQLLALRDLGVSILSLTWNGSNWSGDGVYGDVYGGLSERGKQFVTSCRANSILIDVSHLSDRALVQLFQLDNQPLLASHSNCRSICNHPRNATDEQIVELIKRNGLIGLNFVPAFVAPKEANIYKWLLHLEHILSLGGQSHVALGSDYDGTPVMLTGLEHVGKLHLLIEILQKHYSDSIVEQVLWKNWCRFLTENLPLN